MATTVTSTMHSGIFLPTVWSKEVTLAFENARKMAKLVSRFDAEVKSYGETIKIPNFSSITATYKVEGSEVTRSATTESVVTLDIDKWGAIQVVVEDIVKAQSKYDLFKYYSEKLGNSLAELQDDDLMALYTSFSATIGATSNNVGLAQSYLTGAIRTLDRYNVPQSERSLVVEAYGFEDLRNMDAFTRYDATGRAGLFENDIRGKFFGVDIYMTNNCPVTTSLVTALMFHKEAIAMAEQKSIRVQEDYQKRTLDTALVADILYGVKARRTNAAVRVQYGQV